MPRPDGPQFRHLDDDDGPYCANCSNDIEEVFEWNSQDRQDIHPDKRVPCKGCGAI